MSNIRFDKDTEELFGKAIDLWGVEPQFRCCQEECGELISAINQFDRGRGTVEDLSSEVADVLITTMQLRKMIGPLVDKVINEKLERLDKRVKESSTTFLPKGLKEFKRYNESGDL